VPRMRRKLPRRLACVHGLLALLLVSPLAAAKGGHGGGHCGGHGGHGAHGGHGGGQAHGAVPHVGSGHAHALPWDDRLVSVDPRALWHCGFTPVMFGQSPAAVQRSCGAPETTRQVVYGDAHGEHVIDVWSYQPKDSQLRLLKFENGTLISVEAIGPSR